MAYMDSTEIQEQKNPMVVWQKSIRPDTEGAGRHRGAPGNVCIYGPRFDPMEVHYFMDGIKNPPKGARGGGPAECPSVWKISEGQWSAQEDVIGQARLEAGEAIVSFSAGGGGYEDPLLRPPAMLLEDVIEGWISPKRARDVYGVVLAGDVDRWETLSVDEAATAALRESMGKAKGPKSGRDPDGYRMADLHDCWWANDA